MIHDLTPLTAHHCSQLFYEPLLIHETPNPLPSFENSPRCALGASSAAFLLKMRVRWW